jgi:hypothetical protein
MILDTAKKLALVTTIIFLASCKQEGSVTTSTSSDATVNQAAVASTLSPEELGQLGAAIKKQPENLQKILSTKGLTEESFEASIRKVTEDPEASKRYAAAFNAGM